MITLKKIERYWSQYTLGLDALLGASDSLAVFQRLKENHDRAYAVANEIMDLPSLHGKAVLELACGLGLDTTEFVKHGAKVIALDLSRHCINVAQEHLGSLGVRPTFAVADAERLCFPGCSFDVVVARGLLMYTLDPEKVVAEVFRVLKRRGKAVFLLHNKYSWYVFLARLAGSNLYSELKDPPVNRLYTLGDVKNLLRIFSSNTISFDRFPEKIVNRSSLAASLFNTFLAPITKLLPRSLKKACGYYIIVESIK